MASSRLRFYLVFGIKTLFFSGCLILLSFPEPEFDQTLPVKRHNSTQKKKQLFLDSMRPIVEKENNRILNQRQRLNQIYQSYQKYKKINATDLLWLNKLSAEYRIKNIDMREHTYWEDFFKRVDIIPTSLALAQSASESAWGTSRFARLGNSMFGEWTYIKSDGIVPLGRKKGETHHVARFKTVQDSVRSYIRNLNTHWAYEPFRRLRNQGRLQGEIPDGYKLVGGLERYSQRRKKYVEEIRIIMKQNDRLIQRSK